MTYNLDISAVQKFAEHLKCMDRIAASAASGSNTVNNTAPALPELHPCMQLYGFLGIGKTRTIREILQASLVSSFASQNSTTSAATMALHAALLTHGVKMSDYSVVVVSFLGITVNSVLDAELCLLSRDLPVWLRVFFLLISTAFTRCVVVFYVQSTIENSIART